MKKLADNEIIANITVEELAALRAERDRLVAEIKKRDEIIEKAWLLIVDYQKAIDGVTA